MTKLRSNIFIGGGDDDAVFVADKGTTLPTTLAAPGAGFTEVGWLGEDGIEGNENVDRKEFKAHQGGTIVRRKVTGSGRTRTFVALEQNLTVLDLAKPGVTWVKSGTAPNVIVTGTVPEVVQTVEKTWIIDSYDSSSGTHWREMFTGEAVLTGAFKFGNEDITAYSFEIAVYGDPIVITNHAGLVAEVV